MSSNKLITKNNIISDKDTQGIVSLECGAKSVTFVNPKSINIIRYKGPFNQDLFSMPNLKSIHINNDIDCYLISSSNLEKLTIDGACDNYKLSRLHLVQCVNLKYISFRNVFEIDSVYFPEHLEILKLHGAKIRNIINKELLSLKSLNVDRLRNFKVSTPNITKFTSYKCQFICHFEKLEYLVAKGNCDLIGLKNIKKVKTFDHVWNASENCEIVEWTC